MGIFKRLAAQLAFAREVDEQVSEPRPKFIAPPARASLGWNSADRALSLSSVYRAIFIHQVTAVQLGIDVLRGDRTLDPLPALVRKPDVETTRDAFIEHTIGSLWLTGEAFWLHVRADITASRPGEIVTLKPLNPHEVLVQLDRNTDRPTFRYRGKLIPERDISHLKLMRVPGHLNGLGPIQAARLEIEGAIDARDYGSSWFSESGMPSGVLSTDQVLTPDQAKMYREAWNETAEQHGVRVLGQNLSYEPLLLKPADVQFLESQQFSITGIARLFGIPASLMLAAVQGQSRTYQNQIEEWRGYLQFTAMKALREIESALSDLLPGNQKAKFNLDAFLRLDTKSRYEAHRVGIEAGFLTINEARKLEGFDPLDGGDVTTPTRKEIPDAV